MLGNLDAQEGQLLWTNQQGPIPAAYEEAQRTKSRLNEWLSELGDDVAERAEVKADHGVQLAIGELVLWDSRQQPLDELTYGYSRIKYEESVRPK